MFIGIYDRLGSVQMSRFMSRVKMYADANEHTPE